MRENEMRKARVVSISMMMMPGVDVVRMVMGVSIFARQRRGSIKNNASEC